MKETPFKKGRGAQVFTDNPFSKTKRVKEFIEGIDEEDTALENPTEYLEVFPKTIINEVKSADLPFEYSLNPYQGCEHGCLYCYARETHHYWGYDSGAGFEQKILVKKNAAALLEQAFQKKNWIPRTIMLSGNTDCYQPAERKFGITRQILEVCLKYKHPVGIITKNALIERDLDLIKALNEDHLVHVSITLTSLDEELRRFLEPRTVSAVRKLKTIETLSTAGIPVNIMMAPIIPGLNSHEIFALAEAVSKCGASSLHYTIVRLNGSIGEVFIDWLEKTYPDRANKVIHQVMECHGGSIADFRPKLRMQGEGNTANMIAQMITLARNKFFKDRSLLPLDHSKFIQNAKGQLHLL